jgi:iron(III) transport system ATP-binding protein
MARVLGRSFRGSDFIYQLALSSGESVLAQVASHHRHAVGEMIGVQLDLNHLIAFDCI